jgi:hypothetical protein
MGIQINGQTDTISATDGSFTISGASGNLTGNLTGNATGLSGTPNLNVGVITATSFSGDGSALTGLASDAITEGNTSVECVDTGSDGHITFDTEGTEAARFDSSQRLLVGTPTASTSGVSKLFQVVDSAGASIGLGRTSGSPISNGEVLGGIDFLGAGLAPGAYIRCVANGEQSSTTDLPSDLTFATTPNASGTNQERMRITRDGYIVNSTNYSADGYTDSNLYIYDDRSGGHAGTFVNNNTSYAQGNHGVLWSGCSRSATSAYVLFAATSGSGSSLSYGADYEFRLYGDGNGKCDGSWTGGGADYAEMFEWVDGNPDAEDRRGLSVVLEGNKIRAAVDGEDPIGVISANPTILGDAGWNKWTEKHLRDDFGSYVLEEHNVIEWTDEEGKKHIYEDWSIPADVVVPDDAITTTHDENGKRFSHRALNPAYDPDQEYIPREERPEWDAVGLMGKLRIRKGQVTGARWIKMRDISDNVEEWLVR